MFEIYTYGNNSALYVMLNGIASLMGSDDYMGLVRTISFLAFLFAMVGGALTYRFHALSWFLGLVFVYMVMFVPKVDVIVIDKTSTNPPVTVSNVPLGFAFFGHLTSKIGDYLTDAFETVFSLPNELRYAGNGPMFGSKVLASTMRLEITQSELKKDINNFIRNCTYYDLLEGRILLSTLTTSATIWTTLSATNAGRFTTIWSGGVETTTSCVDAYDQLSGRLNTAVTQAINYYGLVINPGAASGAIAATLYSSQIEAAYGTLMGITAASTDIILQNFMVNEISDSGFVIGQELNDPATVQVALATAQARATANTSYRSMAKIAEEALPKIRNVIEVITIGVFPFVFLLFLLPSTMAAMALKSYLMTLMWVQLWAPLYAILNFVMVNAHTASLTARVGGYANLVIRTAADIGETVISDQAIAGYMVVAIPLIATALVKGLEAGMSGLAGSVMQPATSAAQSASSTIAAGNINYGNMNMATEKSFNSNSNSHDKSFRYNDPSQWAHSNAYGKTVVGGDGGAFVNQNTGSLKASPKFGTNHIESAQSAIDQSDALSVTAAVSENDRVANERGLRNSASVRTDAKTSKDLQSLKEIGDSINSKFFHGDKAEASRAIAAGANMGTPGLVKLVTGAKLNASGKWSNSDTESVQIAQEYAKQARKNAGVSENSSIVEQYAKSDEFTTTNGLHHSDSQEFSRQRKLGQEARQMHQEMVQANNGVDTNLTKEFADWMMEKNGFGPEAIKRMDAGTQARHAQDFTDEYVGQKMQGLQHDIIDGSGLSPRFDQPMPTKTFVPGAKPLSKGPDGSSIQKRADNGINTVREKVNTGGDNVRDEARTRERAHEDKSRIRSKWIDPVTAYRGEQANQVGNSISEAPVPQPDGKKPPDVPQ